MSMNEGMSQQPRTMAVFVNNTTTVPGQPVKVGQFNGFAQTASDGGAAAGRAPLTPIPGEAVRGGKYNKPLWCTIAITGEAKTPVIFTGARSQGDPVYITPAGTLTDIPNAGANTLFGCLTAPYTGGAATVSVFVWVICGVA